MTKKIRSVSNTCIIMLVCIGINYMGKVLAADWHLPLWMDSIGTGMSACLLGPFFGALCGATNNILYGMRNVTSYAYAFTSVAIAIVMGICMRRHMIRDWFGVFTTSALVSAVAVIVSTPFNLIFFQGYNGNLWGDALFDMFRYYRIPVVIASGLSELLVDFPDKVVTVCIIFGILGIIKGDRFECNAERKSSGALMIGIVVTAALIGSGQKCVAATAGNKYTSTYSQTVYNGENGLIGGEANDIVETKDGYLWIGTYSGLYRFDGSTFDTMSDMKDVKNVNCLFEDEEGRLWIGTNDNGVSIYVRDKISNILTVQNDLASNSIRCIAEDEQGNYYIGTSDALSIVTISNGLKVRKTLQEIMYARSIATGKAGDVAVVNNSGQLFIINNQMIKETFTLKTGNAETFYTCCKYMDNGDLLVGTTTNEMYRLRKTNGKYRTIKRYTTGNLQQISSIASDDQGNYWVCSGSGIGYLQGEKFHTFDTNTFNSSIDNMTMDYQGNLWFTSSRLGLLKLSKTCFTDLFRQYSLEKRVVNTVTKWQDCIYIGTDDGLQIIDEKQQCVSDNKLTRKLRGRRIRCMTVDSAGHLWIAISGEEGLLEVTPSLQITEYGPNKGTISNRFRTVMELKDGTMAASENTGIDFYFYNGILYYETTQEKGKIYKVESSELLKPEFIKKYDFEKYSKSINTALDSIYENFASLADSMKYENKPGEGYELNGSHVSVYSVLLEKSNLKKAASGTIDALYDNSDTSVYMGMFSAYGVVSREKLKRYTDRQLARFTYAQADIHIGENDNLKRIKIDNYQLDFDYDGTEYDFTISADIKFDDAADTPPGN